MEVPAAITNAKAKGSGLASMLSKVTVLPSWSESAEKRVNIGMAPTTRVAIQVTIYCLGISASPYSFSEKLMRSLWA
jgi:hypothetical protein